MFIAFAILGIALAATAISSRSPPRSNIRSWPSPGGTAIARGRAVRPAYQAHEG
jgi:hypothetical protein